MKGIILSLGLRDIFSDNIQTVVSVVHSQQFWPQRPIGNVWNGSLRNISVNTFPPFACDSHFDSTTDTRAQLQLQLSATPAQQWLTCSLWNDYLCSFKPQDVTGRNLGSARDKIFQLSVFLWVPTVTEGSAVCTGCHWAETRTSDASNLVLFLRISLIVRSGFRMLDIGRCHHMWKDTYVL